MDNKILGNWENSEVKYEFKINKNGHTIFILSTNDNNKFIEYFSLKDNLITFYLNDIGFQYQILSISETVLIIGKHNKNNTNLILFRSSCKELNQYLELHKWVAGFLESKKKQPTFKDYWLYVVKENQDNIFVWNKQMFEEKSLLWDTLLLGDSQWKEIWAEYYDSKESKLLPYFLISLFIGSSFTILSIIRHSTYYSDSMFDGFFNFLIFIMALIITVIIFYIASILYSYLQKESLFQVEHYFNESFAIFFDSKVWKNKIVIKIILASFIFLFLFFRIFKNPFSLLYFQVSILIVGFLTLLIKRGRVLITYVLAGMLPIISMINIFRFETYGIYYHWLITGSDPLINYGYTGEQGKDPLTNKEFFWNIKEWENLGNPFPNSENELEYFTTDFFDTFIFYSFNGVFLFIIIVYFFLLGKIFFNNLRS